MIFIDNKYTTIYYNIILSAQARTLLKEEYTEKHHIMPKSLGGTDNTNIVKLTAREHFICHWLLTKMLTGDAKYKMVCAVNKMLLSSKKQKRYKITGRKYELLKKQFAKINLFNNVAWQEEQRALNHSGKKRSAKTKQNLKDAWAVTREDRAGTNHPLYGQPVSIATRTNRSVSMTGKLVKEKNPMYGKSHSAEVKQILSDRLLKTPLPKKYIQCEYCTNIIDAGNYKRWHGNKCKLKN